MINAMRAEWAKLMRRGTLYGGAGTMLATTVLVVVLLFATAEANPPPPSALQRESTMAFAVLEAPQGLALALGFAGQMMGVIALVLFAQGIASEYALGTLKVQLTREPRRLVLLAGKLTATAAFVAIAVALACLLGGITAVLMAAARGLETSQWWTGPGMREFAAVLGRIVASSIVWGLFGTFLGVLLRSPAPAVGIGIGYLVVFEGLLALAWRGATEVLPGQVLQEFILQRSPDVSLAQSSLTVLAYAVIFLGVAAVEFHRRDIAS